MFWKASLSWFFLAGAAWGVPSLSNLPATAQIAWEHEAKSRLIADDRLWRCVADLCQGQAFNRPASRLRTCRQLARAGGRVVSFEVAGIAIPSEELERCNGGARRKQP